MRIMYWSSDVCSSDLARPCICLEERGVGLGMTRSPIITDTRGLTPEGVAPGLHLPEGTPPDRGFFDDLNSEVGDKGFLVTSTEDLFNWARTGSLWWMNFGLRSEEHTSELQSLMR